MENILTEHKDERRDTIAFMPETMMEMLKFADEMDMDDHRSLGQIETQPLIDRYGFLREKYGIKISFLQIMQIGIEYIIFIDPFLADCIQILILENF